MKAFPSNTHAHKRPQIGPIGERPRESITKLAVELSHSPFETKIDQRLLGCLSVGCKFKTSPIVLVGNKEMQNQKSENKLPELALMSTVSKNKLADNPISRGAVLPLGEVDVFVIFDWARSAFFGFSCQEGLCNRLLVEWKPETFICASDYF